MTSRSNDVSFLTGANATYLSELYKRFLTDPGQVDPEWREFFGTLGDDARGVMDDLVGPAWQPREAHIIGAGNGVDTVSRAKANGKAAQMTIEQLRAAARDSIQAFLFIRMHRVRGHLYADLDPLGIVKPEYHPELEYNTYGFTDADLDREIFLNGIMGFEVATLRQIVQRVRETYCAKIGVEYMHMVDQDQKVWIQERIEGIHNRTEFTEKGRRAILERLTHAETFEKFCDKRFTGTKRFGLDGGEATIPGLEQILKRGGQLGVKEIVIGMPHRGRLNVLSNMMGKPFQAIFSEFLGQSANPSDIEGSGDVKYHLGTSSDREFDGNVIHLSLTANPSHLEAVNPVVCGKVRAKQTQRGDAGRRQVMGLLMHGDAAFAGQGLVAETLDLSQLKGYRTGGTIHFIVNNQIGFTTNPVSSRSGPYCSDVAKIVQAPIFHVNGDDPEAVVHVARIASEYRHDFQQDVVIDMFCYRRHGHNEGDEPAFTQPLMYKTISKHPRVRQIYAERLEKDGVIARGEADKIIGEIEHRLEEAFSAAKGFKPNKADWLEGAWTGLEKARGEPHPGETGVSLDVLREVGAKLCETPKGFNVNSKITRQLKAKKEAIETGKDIDWATAEALAFGSLLVEGTPVRLSGQDCRRGTFSQRHAVLVDQETEADYTPLANLRPDQALFEVFDSPLAEASVLGFEYGYSLAEPNVLVMWEAQFGDFSNGAQIIIDQFISSGESKWLRMSGLTMLLPHGYEGQGPEHSSARLERYLQLCAEDNIQVVNCTTPANYFHVLRRQLRRNFRKPLIVMTPKSLLRHKLCVSDFDAMGPQTQFHRLLPDGGKTAPEKKIRRVVLCSGKVYYDLFEERAKRKIDDVYLLRVEQLYPFPYRSMEKILANFPNAEIVWCQEEPKNMGPWHFIEARIEEVLDKVKTKSARPAYVGRVPAASPATGLYSRHLQEQAALVDAALTVKA